MKILTFSSLYPNAAEPTQGIFVENRLRHLVASGEVEAKVVAPVPWFPFQDSRFGVYSRYAQAPQRDRRHGLAVEHPRFFLLPKVSMSWSPYSLYLGARTTVQKIIERGYDFDLIDAHYFYPDGVAAALLARSFGKPVVITGRGTDLNLLPRYAGPRRWIKWAAGQADGLVTVSQALKQALVELGLSPDRVVVLRNGVDLKTFAPDPGARARLYPRVKGPLLLSVGQLIIRKGHDLILQALSQIPEARLVIVGDGPEEARLKALSTRLGLDDRVDFLSRRRHEGLAELYSAADLLLLASDREGWPNVLLESMACGTPVVAAAIWGVPEIVTTPEAGRLLKDRSPGAIAEAATSVLLDPPSPAAVRQFAEQFSWDETTAGQLALFRTVLENQKSSSRTGPET